MVHVPEVDERLGRADEREPLLELDARALERVGRDAHRDRAVVADGLAHALERLEPEARAVLERAAVLVRAAVVDAARGTASAGRCASRRRRRCRSPPRAPGARPRPTRPASRRMSALSIALRHRERLELARELERRERRQRATRAPRRRSPPCQSSTPASAPWRCASSVISRSARTSSSSQSRAETDGYSSVSGLIEQYSVHTAAQPPSAFMPRNAACVHGFSTPKPVQCGTW